MAVGVPDIRTASQLIAEKFYPLGRNAHLLRAAIISRMCFLLAGSLPVISHAQGLLPVPNISGATVTSTAELVPGFPTPGTFVYRYSVENPLSSTGVSHTTRLAASTI